MKNWIFILLATLLSCSESDSEKEVLVGDEPETALVFNWEFKQQELSKNEKVEWEEALAVINNYFVDTLSYEKRVDPIQVVYFTDADAFKTFQTEELGKSKPNPSGFYSPASKKLYMINANGSSSNAKNVFLHEGTHALFSAEINGGAIVLNEGLATIFQTLFKENDSYFVTVQANYQQKIKNLAANGELYDLSELFNLTINQWQSNAKVTYVQSNSVIFFMMSKHKSLFKEIVDEYKKSEQQRRNYIEMINLLYNGGIDQFKEDWQVWLNDANYDNLKIE
ncbi:hypothetical protein EMN47_12720 [Prolixibacteraceae bacterium JC049]|nr:hypothetical protein [Prolixibacteraceae bacterium JC049]